MTEDEAKTKWCPFVRHEGDEGSTFNRGIIDPLNIQGGDPDGYRCTCIGSACMAWRFTNKTALHNRNQWKSTTDKSGDDAHQEYVKDFPLEGRCGLVGA